MQRDEDEVQAGRAGRREELALPVVERGEALAGRHDVARALVLLAAGVAFVGEVVGVTREGVDGVHVVLHFLRHEAADGEILVVLAGELGAGLVGLGDGHRLRRAFRLVGNHFLRAYLEATH